MIKQRKGLSSEYFEGKFYLRLYNTTILQESSYDIELNSGGWKTNHTKKCINENLPEGFRVYQKDFTWYVDTPLKKGLEFKDNMIIEK